MSETISPTEALLNFAKWMEPLEGYKSVQRIYGLTAADAHAVLEKLAAETTRADELELGIRATANQCESVSNLEPCINKEVRTFAATVANSLNALLAAGEEANDVG
jgi:hypothetical protein